MSRTDGDPFAGRFPELLAAAAVVVPGLLLTAVAAVVVGLLAGAVGGSGLAGLLLALVVGVGLLGTGLVAALVWIAVSRARRSIGTELDDRRVEWFRRARDVEETVPAAERLGLAERLEPDEETVVEALQRRYVAGDLDEVEFERELERLIGDRSDPERPRGVDPVDDADATERVTGRVERESE